MIEAKTDVSQLPINQVLCGDCVEVMTSLPHESIDMTMFSPPYWGLRDYGLQTQIIWDGKAGCEHEWVEEPMALIHENRNFSQGTQEEVHGEKGTTYIKKFDAKVAGFCSKCGAWRGQLGLEPTPQLYIAHMTALCQHVKQVLKKTGSMYIVIGDTYYNNPSNQKSEKVGARYQVEVGDNSKRQNRMVEKSNWLQPKQLLGIPWRVAIALQEDGWILRNDIIWNKPNHMPSSVEDRLTNAYEHIFHFVQSRKYYYDLDAIREKPISIKPSGNKQRKPSLQPRNSHVGRSIPWSPHKCTTEGTMLPNGARIRHGLDHSTLGSEHILGKNPSDVFQSKKEPYLKNNPHMMRLKLDQHTALDPSSPMDLSHPLGKNPSDVIKWTSVPGQTPQGNLGHGGTHGNLFNHPNGKNPADFWNITTQPFKGAHFAVYPEEVCIRPIKSSCPPNGIVLDPMCGSGTTLAVAKKLGRKYIGIELNPKYIEIAEKRLSAIPEKITTFF